MRSSQDWEEGRGRPRVLLNVMQHTADPQMTTQGLYNLMGPRSEMYINYYLRNEKMPLVWWMRQVLREGLFSRLPKQVTLNLFRVLSAAAMVPGLDQLLCMALLVRGDVIEGPGHLERKYQQTVLNSYDYYAAHDFQYYSSESILRRLFEGSGISLGGSQGAIRARWAFGMHRTSPRTTAD